MNLNAQQNLVPNGSFEEYNWCPDNLNGYFVNSAKHWFMPTTGSSDYFNSCGDVLFNVPQNYIGYQTARTGNAYAGFVSSLAPTDINYVEYLSVKFLTPLSKGKVYQLTYYLSLADSVHKNGQAQQFVSHSGVLFTKDSIFVNDFELIDEIPQLKSNENIFINDSLGWQKITFFYLANGDENYITFGIFFNLSEIQYNYNDITTNYFLEFYYYIDDVELIESSIEIPNVFTPNGDEINDFYGLNFNLTDSFNLKVLNRWGNLVFDSELAMTNYWDGKSNDENCVEGVYFYVITIGNNKFKGFFELLR